ncbi:MAG: molecular chaperone TorD [Candidatus Moraniibacteriota bacterium]|nr:MAG: molecular chaperone TorD [Candidatus Moranbacteria bacterium]
MFYKIMRICTFCAIGVLTVFVGVYFYDAKQKQTPTADTTVQHTEQSTRDDVQHSDVVQIQEEQVTKAKQDDEKDLRTGINIDCARRFCTLDELKKYVDIVAEDRNPFIHVHFTDNENVGIECLLLDQVADEAHRNENGTYTNPQTKKRFLSRAQAQELRAYAEEKGVDFVPEIDLPAHAGGFFRLARIKYGSAYVASVAADIAEGEISITDEKGLAFAESLYGEYADLFAGNRYFHMGCDELFNQPADAQIAYINRMAKFLHAKGFDLWMWPDFITKKHITNTPNDITITYWSADGDTEDDAERAQRRRVRATVPELQDAGFSVINYNSYYLYFVPSLESCTPDDMGEMLWDIKNRWKLSMWDGEYGAPAKRTDGIVGAGLSIWREDARGLSSDTIYGHASRFYRAMADNVLQEQ